MKSKIELANEIEELKYENYIWRENYNVCFNELEKANDKLYVIKRKLKKLKKYIKGEE